jgi:hypothetical protein
VASALLAATALVGSVVVMALGPTAAAQSAAPSFTLAGQSAWIAPGAVFVMRLRGDNVPAGAQVAITAHDAVGSRSAFDASVSGANLPPTRDRTTFAFDALVRDPATGDRLLALATTTLTDRGVYPLEVDLRNASDESLAHFLTHIVVAPVGSDGQPAGGTPLQVAWVWPLRAEPAYLGVDERNPATVDALKPAGRIGRQVSELAANTTVPLTLVPSPETLDAWTALATATPELAAGADALRSTADRDQVLTSPFVPLNLPSILDHGLGGVVYPELARGVSALETFFRAHNDPSTALPGPLDLDSLRVLQNASARRLVLDGNALTPADEKYTPAHPYRMEVVPGDDSTAVTVVATDPGFEQFLSGGDPPALRAAHLLAGLAVVAGEQPSLTRGVAITNPDGWDADPTFVAAVLAGLHANPQLQPTTIAGLLDAVPVATADGDAHGAPVYRQLVPYRSPAPPVSLTQYEQGQASRDAVARYLGAGSPGAIAADRALVTSVAAAWSDATGRQHAGALLRSIDTSTKTFLGQIKVQPRSTITITSSRAEIPIGFQNTAEKPITVHIRLRSDRLLFPDGAERDVLLPAQRSTTVRVAVETRGSGTVPVFMTVTTPDGLPISGTTRISVRSTFVSGVGVFLTVGAVVFLAVWWGWDIRRRRKRSRLRHPTFPIVGPSGQPA